MQLAHSILTFHSSAILNTECATGAESRLRTTDKTDMILKLILFTIFTYEQTPMFTHVVLTYSKMLEKKKQQQQ